MGTRVILVRHGHVEGIVPPRFRGRSEIPLSQEGLRQAAATRDHLRGLRDVQALYTSPLQRCVRTAAIIGEPHGLAPQILPDLNDIDYGTWQGRTYDEVQASEPSAFAGWMTAPDLACIPCGERLADVAARAAHALWTALRTHPDVTTLLVSHDSVHRLALLQAMRLSPSRYWYIRQEPCAVSVLERTGEDWIVCSLNETAHLQHSTHAGWRRCLPPIPEPRAARRPRSGG